MQQTDLEPVYNITITNPSTGQYLQFYWVTQVKIMSSWKRLTDTCEIILPRKLAWGNMQLLDFAAPGFKVVVQLGYNGYGLTTEFIGYITRIEPNVPVKLYCQDEMWKLKQTNYNLSWSDVNLQTLVKAIAPGYTLNVLSADIGAFRIANASAAKALQEIKKIGFAVYFSPGTTTLNVGFAYSVANPNPLGTQVIYNFQKNIIKNDLQFRTQDENQVQVIGYSIQANNKRVQCTAGKAGGDIYTVPFPMQLAKPQLQSYVNNWFNKVSMAGYRGTLSTFGLPNVQHGDVAIVQDTIYPERDGSYYVDSVETMSGALGEGGYKRKVFLGALASLQGQSITTETGFNLVPIN